MIRSYPLLALLVLSIGLPPTCRSSDAAVISRDWKTPGDGLLTYDTVNRREWLDLAEAQLFKFPGDTLEERYQAVVAETSPGGMFAGFSVATRDDVFALADSAGIDTTTSNFVINGQSASDLIEIVGATFNLNSNRWAIGAVDEVDAGQRITANAAYLPGTRGAPTAGFGYDSNTRDDNGVWLYRQVPEPHGFGLICGIIGFFSARRICCDVIC